MDNTVDIGTLLENTYMKIDLSGGFAETFQNIAIIIDFQDLIRRKETFTDSARSQENLRWTEASADIAITGGNEIFEIEPLPCLKKRRVT